MRAEINEIENGKTMKPKAGSFRQQDGPLVRLFRKERRQITNIKNERGEITTDSTDIKKTIRGY